MVKTTNWFGWKSHFVAALMALFLTVRAAEDIRVAITMICRNEEVNFRSNLALWLPIVDYFVFMMDSRTNDQSESVISNILSGKAEFRVVKYQFDGFGHARTASLDAVWNYFPQATHVIIADPDWRPDTTTMKKSDLDLEHDVFRFMAYDRNGATTRRMDWLLRNREGLRMRYNLHEVLDIGPYSITPIPWVVHEIEKPGTWHTAVGHGNSMSAKRFLFDLEMLYKDVDEYGHDPHTHYYLGVTHHAYVEKMIVSGNPMTPELMDHLDKAVNNLELRIISEYTDDFQEERWASMMILAGIYWHLKRDFVKAHHWFSMCRDFNPQQIECGMSLTRLLMGYGAFETALAELEIVLRTERTERQMLNHFKDWECDLPLLAIEILGLKLRLQPETASPQDAIYLALMRQMGEGAKCGKAPGSILVNAEVASIVSSQLQRVGYTWATSSETLCTDESLFQHIRAKDYKLHPCSNIQSYEVSQKVCRDFSSSLKPPVEEYQIQQSDAYLGALSLVDIAHHIYGGDASRLAPSDRPYRILFAEYFNPRLLFALLGHNRRMGMTTQAQVEIVVVTPRDSGVTATIQSAVNACGYASAAILVVEQTLSDYFSMMMSNMQRAKNSQGYDPKHYLFDYIEYNAGVSVSPLYREHLRYISQFLFEDGVVGATFFAKNVHQELISQLVANLDVEAQPPFSLQPRRIVQEYLKERNWEFLTKDEELVGFLAGDIDGYLEARGMQGKRNRDLLDRGGQAGRAFSQEEVEEMLMGAGLAVQSWFPTAYSHPYDEIQHYSVQKFKALGVTHEDVLYSFFPSFRYAVYATKRLASVPGRLFASSELLFDSSSPTSSSTGSSSIFVLDRMGALGASFAAAPARGRASMSTIFAFAHYGAKSLNFTFIATPSISASLAALSSTPSIAQLEEANFELYRSIGATLSPDTERTTLLQLLDFLERLNVISFWRPPRGSSSSGNIGAAVGAASSSLATTTMASSSQQRLSQGASLSSSAAAAQSTGGSGGGVQRVGGLNIATGKKSTTHSATSSRDDGESSSSSASSGSTTSKSTRTSCDPRTGVCADTDRATASVTTSAASSTSDAGGAGAASVSAGAAALAKIEAKAARMRSMGFPEKIITEAMQAELSRLGHNSGSGLGSGSSSSTSSSSSHEAEVTVKTFSGGGGGGGSASPTNSNNEKSDSYTNSNSNANINTPNTIDKALEVKAERMRKLGFPEHMVAEATKAEAQRTQKKRSEAGASAKGAHKSKDETKKERVPGEAANHQDSLPVLVPQQSQSTEADHEVATATTGGAAVSGEDVFKAELQDVAQRMRKLGFTETIIDEAIAAEEGRWRLKEAKQASSAITPQPSPIDVPNTATSFPLQSRGTAVDPRGHSHDHDPEASSSSSSSSSPSSSNINNNIKQEEEEEDNSTQAMVQRMRRGGWSEDSIAEAVKSKEIREKARAGASTSGLARSLPSAAAAAAAAATLEASATVKQQQANDAKTKNGLSDKQQENKEVASKVVPLTMDVELLKKSDRMRKMGFPEHMIEEAVKTEISRREKKAAAAASATSGDKDTDTSRSRPAVDVDVVAAIDTSDKLPHAAAVVEAEAEAAASHPQEQKKKSGGAGFLNDFQKKLSNMGIGRGKENSENDMAFSSSSTSSATTSSSGGAAKSAGTKQSLFDFRGRRSKENKQSTTVQKEQRAVVREEPPIITKKKKKNTGIIINGDNEEEDDPQIIGGLFVKSGGKGKRKGQQGGGKDSTPSGVSGSGKHVEDVGRQATVKSAVAGGPSATPNNVNSPPPTAVIEESVNKITSIVPSIRLPSVQSASDLRSSYRNMDCFPLNKQNQDGIQPPSPPSLCSPPAPPKRPSAELTATSLAKLQFDIAQLEYIATVDLSSVVTAAFADYLPYFEAAYTASVKHLELAGKSIKDFRGTIRLNSTSDSGKAMRYPINRVIYLPPDSLISSPAVAHAGALVQLSRAISELSTSDFVVVDVILKKQSLLDMSEALLRSTVWFDACDGNTFIAHHDDGLVHESFKSLAQQVAASLSLAASKGSVRTFRVTRYFAVAMPLLGERTSPVITSVSGEVTVVLWLNPATVPAKEDTESDGLLIFDTSAAGCLFSQGISAYPSAHQDFLSVAGNLSINIAARCPQSTSELVPRRSNRMIIIGPRRPFVFSAPPISELPDIENSMEDIGDDFFFAKSTSTAFVVTLSLVG